MAATASTKIKINIQPFILTLTGWEPANQSCNTESKLVSSVEDHVANRK